VENVIVELWKMILELCMEGSDVTVWF